MLLEYPKKLASDTAPDSTRRGRLLDRLNGHEYLSNVKGYCHGNPQGLPWQVASYRGELRFTQLAPIGPLAH